MKIEISNGELVDKVCILEIKLKNIKDPKKLINIRKEYEILLIAENEILGQYKFRAKYEDLLNTNKQLWIIEDKLRIKEKKQEFDQEFIDLARSVYFTNDKRSDIKKQINIITDSGLVEEKSYQKYS